MFTKLKQRWKVNTLSLALIICTFALGGSLCGYLGKRLMALTGLEKNLAWFILYILLITLIWPLCVLLISIPLGQFQFFRNYLSKIWQRISGKHQPITHISIFASGAGSNAQQIINHFKGNNRIKVGLIVCNKPEAGVIGIARKENIPVHILNREEFYSADSCTGPLKQHHTDFIVLAGFLWKVPAGLIKQYPGKIINIHPALLPKYGGKGMYGSKVHEAVLAAGEKESGITIHYVDEIYDHGAVIFQARCPIDGTDTPETLAQKIHQLEHRHFPVVIEQLLHTK